MLRLALVIFFFYLSVSAIEAIDSSCRQIREIYFGIRVEQVLASAWKNDHIGVSNNKKYTRNYRMKYHSINIYINYFIIITVELYRGRHSSI